jgi:Kdo2-lipid IVA lauroyltransferase/acyltransferase
MKPFVQFVGYCIARLFLTPFRWMPFRLLYILSDITAFAFYHLGYRKAVVFDNLRRCFPEKTPAEIRAIAKKSYQNLADVTLETVKALVTPIHAIRRRIEFHNLHLLNEQYDRGRSLVLAGGHYNNWEWAALGMGDGLKGLSLIIYKTLSNPYMDAWMLASRARANNMALRPMQETFPALKQYQRAGTRTGIILGADQSPSNAKTAQWVTFFNQPTACLPGPDLIGRQFDSPVFFFDIQRVRRGYYTITYTPICLEPATTLPGEITRLFMEKLEVQIRQDPSNWLWSHRRWKLKEEN